MGCMVGAKFKKNSLELHEICQSAEKVMFVNYNHYGLDWGQRCYFQNDIPFTRN